MKKAIFKLVGGGKLFVNLNLVTIWDNPTKHGQMIVKTQDETFIVVGNVDSFHRDYRKKEQCKGSNYESDIVECL
jgi:hypothetical protein